MKQIFKFIGMIFKGIWKLITFIRLAFINLLFLAIVAVIFFGFIHSDAPPAKPEKKSALVLNLSGPIVEQSSYANPMDSFSESLLGQELPKQNVLYQIVSTIRHAKDDPNITGLVLSLGKMPETNLTKLRYIAKALNEFKTSGKPIYAVGSFYNQSQYYLASYADKVLLSPDGAVLIKGYSAYALYYKTLLDKLDVNTHVFRVGTYKSAVEPFIRDNMSKAAKQDAADWLGQLWGAYVDDVATNRHIKPNTLTPTMSQFLALMKKNKGDLAVLAKNIGLVDELATRQQVRAELTKKFGSDGKDSYNAISYYKYLSQIPSKPKTAASDIAVIVANGTIIDGNQMQGKVGGDTIAQMLRKVQNDDKIKAVVLRVDSPGGSAFASDVILNEIKAVEAAGKPVVVSMSSLAASGGYWISMGATKIIAQPTTLTGSIGIFSVITTFEKGLNKIGVYTDGVGTTPFSGVGLTTGLNKGISAAMQMGVEHGYNRFTSLVSQYRHIPLAKVDKIAQGRVWTGRDAKQLGLVDQLGDFDDAIALAAKLAKLKSYNLDWMKKQLTPAQQIISDLMKQVSVHMGITPSSLIPQSLLPVASQIKESTSLMNSLNDPKGQYALCLTCSVQ
ncbi:signal peptide peptidase SppA [Vibrio sp. S4M6]|uniref:signal peptide peptidase SppA n=1 Tax=Vibrio sinus TaxID=2946865 RepID=UPI00202A0E31|nr:signal peptide peptidase SppA [Vibrio sinus]MCL9783075.1 signal peptide peptidase SppA [Vibrio sinus]